MKIVNVDLDGVVYPFHLALEQFALKYRLIADDGDLQLPDVNQWNMWEDWGISYGQWKSVFRKGVEQGVVWGMGQPIYKSVESLWRLSDAGWNIRITTHRLVHKFGHHAAITQTADWLEQHNVPFWDICFLGKSPKSTLYANAIVDDNLQNVVEFRETWPDSVCILFDQPWNQEEGGDDYRATGWEEITPILINWGMVLDTPVSSVTSTVKASGLPDYDGVVWEGVEDSWNINPT